MRYTKNIGGMPVVKDRNKIIIIKDGRQWYNPSHEMLIADGWVEYVEPQPTEAELFEEAKEGKRSEILDYDSSEEVNIFYIGDLPAWLDKATRTGLLLRFQAEMATGKTDTELWHKGVAFPLPLSTAMQMLYAIELYASACYDRTQAHLATIDTLTTIAEVEAYDHTTGYPDKLRF
jgi:hypothetical protein